MPYFYFDTFKNAFEDNDAQDYAMREGKYEPSEFNNYEEPLAVDLINIDDDYRECWGSIMDNTRDYWNDINNYHSNNQVCYRHYKLSPNPIDNITLDEFRDYVAEYCERVYEGRFEIAVVYHQDNANHILHAHIYINTPVIKKDGLVQGTNYISTFFKEKNYPGRFQWHMALREQMAFERGWHSFLDDDIEDIERLKMQELGWSTHAQEVKVGRYCSEENEMLFDEDRLYFENNYYYNVAQPYKRPYLKTGAKKSSIKNPNESSYYSKTENKIIKNNGTSWKEIIREKIDIAKHMAKNETEFIENIQELDLNCYINKQNEFVFELFHTAVDKPSKVNKFSIQGKNLGSDYSRVALLNYIETRQKLLRNIDMSDETWGTTDEILEQNKMKEYIPIEFIFEKYKIPFATGSKYSRAEFETIKRDGWSRNEDIRQRVSRAMDNSYDELSFIFKCSQYGIDVEITNKNDYKFHHPDKNISLAVTGERLGSKFKKKNILNNFGYSNDYLNSFANTKNTKEAIKTVNNRQKFFSKMRSLGTIKDEQTNIFVQTTSDIDTKLTPKDVIKMLEIKDKFQIVEYEDIINLINTSSGNDKIELQFAQDVLIKLGSKELIRKSNIYDSHLDFTNILFNKNQKTDNTKNVSKKKEHKKDKDIENIKTEKTKTVDER